MDDLDNYLNFYSVSGDGRVTNWSLVKVFFANYSTYSKVFFANIMYY